MSHRVYQPQHGRRRHRRNRRPGQPLKVLWRILPRLLSLVLLIELVAACFTSPLLAVRHVQVNGLHTVMEREVLARAKVPIGVNIFRVGLDKIVARTAAHPVLETVHASWKLPHTVIIRVKERKPVLLLHYRDAYFEVDKTGIPFRLRPGALPRLPVLEAGDISSLKIGQKLNSPSLKTAFLLLRSKSFPTARDISKISVDLNGNLCLNIRDGVEVRLGQPDRLTLKLNKLRILRTDCPEDYQRLEYVDFSYPEHPAKKDKNNLTALTGADDW